MQQHPDKLTKMHRLIMSKLHRKSIKLHLVLKLFLITIPIFLFSACSEMHVEKVSSIETPITISSDSTDTFQTNFGNEF